MAIMMFFLVIFLATCNAVEIPAVLIFGDSTVDTGNNNYINTVIKGNHFPYGEDFPGKVATGRFSNGKLITDLVASELGIKETVPPFLDPKLPDKELVTGVCFASAGSGFDDLTTLPSRAIPVLKQTDMFKSYIARLKKIVGEDRAKKIINEAVVVVSAGTNDLVFNFYSVGVKRRLEFTIDEYHDFLHKRIQNFTQGLYDLGCRKIVVAGVPPIGCLPIQIATTLKNSLNGRCVNDVNTQCESYNRKLVKMLSGMQSNLNGSLILYANIYDPFINMLTNPKKYGFKETKAGCCPALVCTKMTPTCGNHSEYMFWDIIHPTEVTYHYLTDQLVKDLLDKLQ